MSKPFFVIAGLGLAIPTSMAQRCPYERDGREFWCEDGTSRRVPVHDGENP